LPEDFDEPARDCLDERRSGSGEGDSERGEQNEREETGMPIPRRRHDCGRSGEEEADDQWEGPAGHPELPASKQEAQNPDYQCAQAQSEAEESIGDRVQVEHGVISVVVSGRRSVEWFDAAGGREGTISSIPIH